MLGNITLIDFVTMEMKLSPLYMADKATGKAIRNSKERLRELKELQKKKEDRKAVAEGKAKLKLRKGRRLATSSDSDVEMEVDQPAAPKMARRASK